MLYEYLKEKFGENEPIFVSEISVPGMSDANIRQQLKQLTDKGLLKRFDTGIYFIPKETGFPLGSMISGEQVIEKKYLKNDSDRCGYISGLTVVNQLGLTTQVPMVYEIVTNKATTDYRKTMLARLNVIVRKPYVEITEDNYKALQFLDLIKDIDIYSEVTRERQKERLLAYMKAINLKFSDMEPYLKYYPDKIYKNLYETGLLNGISA